MVVQLGLLIKKECCLMSIRKVLRIMLLIGFILVAIRGVFFVQGLKKKYDSISVRLTEGVTRKALLESLEIEREWNTCKIEQVTALTETRQNVKAEGIDQMIQTYVYQIYGDVNKVMQGDLMLGAYLLYEDNDGCMLTDTLAYELFGSIKILGLGVIIEDKTYYVRGIVTGSDKAVFYETKEDKATFNCLELLIKDEEGGYYAKQFVEIYGLSDAVIIEESYLISMLGNFALLPFLIAFLFLIVRGNLLLRELINIGWIRIIGVVFSVIVSCIMVKVFVYFPLRLVPTNWSDFDHFSRCIEDIKNQLNSLMFIKPIVRDVLFKKDLMTAVVLCVASLFGEAYVLHYLNLGIKNVFHSIIENRRTHSHQEDLFLQKITYMED
jgi:hypothetical protein